MCQSNIQANTHIYNRRYHEAEPDKHVIVRELDWTDSALKTGRLIIIHINLLYWQTKHLVSSL